MDWFFQIAICIAAVASLYSAIKIRSKLVKQHKQTMDILEVIERKLTLVQNATYRIEDDTDRVK